MENWQEKKKEKLKKKKRRNRMIIFGVIIIAAVAVTVMGYKLEMDAQNDDIAVEMIVEEGEELVYAQVDSISGNEMTYTLLQAVEDIENNKMAAVFTDTDNISYELSEKQYTVMIPVGTDVITILGTTTTFSRLGAGDVIGIIQTQGQDGDGNSIATVYIVG